MEPAAQEEPAYIRRTAYFSGRVQGVGFRFTTEAIASRFEVAGFVRNLPDGRVELVAEGTKAEIDRFQEALHEAMRACIHEHTESDTPARREFSSFRIAF